MYQPVSRVCPGCKFDRIPEHKIVTQNKKKYLIYTCRYCKMQDIDPYTPTKLWTGTRFLDDDDYYNTE